MLKEENFGLIKMLPGDFDILLRNYSITTELPYLQCYVLPLCLGYLSVLDFNREGKLRAPLQNLVFW